MSQWTYVRRLETPSGHVCLSAGPPLITPLSLSLAWMAGLHVRYHEYTKLKKEKSSTRTLTCSLFGSMGFSCCCCCASCSIAKAGERERERVQRHASMRRIHGVADRWCGVFCLLPAAENMGVICCRLMTCLGGNHPFSVRLTHGMTGARSQLAAAAQRAD